MLQQTQVATVIPYFHRFLEHFPTLPDLANAEEPEILRLWEGLGYYRRARDLLKAACRLREMGLESIPNDAILVRSLPGFGRYTTNAVLSQAFDTRLPILEANSTRLLCRLFGVEGDPKNAANQHRLWQLAETMLPQKKIGAFNQALMEIGALVCTPTAPACEKCPLRRRCRAFALGRQAEIPQRSKSTDITRVAEAAVIILNDSKYLLVQRPPRGRWANLWEFPHEPIADGEQLAQTAARLLETLGVDGIVGPELATLTHSVTRFRITLTAFRVDCLRRLDVIPQYSNHAWVGSDELENYPLSAPQRRLAEALNTAINEPEA